MIRRNDERAEEVKETRALLFASGTAGALAREEHMAESVLVPAATEQSEISGTQGNDAENFADDDDFDLFAQQKPRPSRGAMIGAPQGGAIGGDLNQT